MNRKHSLKFTIGIVIVVVTALMLVTIPLWTNRWRNVDFPCEWFGPPPNLIEVKPDSRFLYCISIYPRNARGGALLTYGSSDEDNITIQVNRHLNLQRQGSLLLVNNEVLRVGETNIQHIALLTLNPWLLATTEISITHEGALQSQQPANFTSDVIFVSGNFTQGWALTPLGLLYFGIGLALIVFDVIERKKNFTA